MLCNKVVAARYLKTTGTNDRDHGVTVRDDDDGDEEYIYTPVLLIVIIKKRIPMLCPGRIESRPVVWATAATPQPSESTEEIPQSNGIVRILETLLDFTVSRIKLSKSGQLDPAFPLRNTPATTFPAGM